jgi:hypothetical protein
MSSLSDINRLIDHGFSLACGLIEKQGTRIPFCVAITASGKRASFVPDNSQGDADTLLSIVRKHIRDSLQEGRYRAVALVRFGKYPEPHDRPSDAVQVTTDHRDDSSEAISCYIPYHMVRGMVVQDGGYVLGQSKERFFTHAA